MPNRIDGPTTPAITTPRTDSPPVLREGSSGEQVKALQTALNRAGFNTGTPDGAFGRGTGAAVKAFQTANGMTADGIVTPAVWAKLGSAPAAPSTPARPGWGTNTATTTPGTWGTSNPAVTNAGSTNNVARNGKVVELTFDDGPNPVNTPKVLDTLKQFGVHATFFVTGQAVKAHPELLRRIIAEGHSIGNHTWDHPDLSKMDQAHIKSELDRTQAAVDEALGHHHEMTLIRPPYGAGPSKVRAAEPGKDVVLWNVDSNDWRYKNDDAKILQNIFDGSESVRARGGTILMHDIHPQSARVLPEVISRLQAQGYDIQKIDDVLANRRSGVTN